jgi:hypothetical protein
VIEVSMTGLLAVAKGTDTKLMIELDGSNAGASAKGLAVDASDSVVRGLRSTASCKASDISGDFNHVEGNFIGTDTEGKIDRGNAGVDINDGIRRSPAHAQMSDFSARADRI